MEAQARLVSLTERFTIQPRIRDIIMPLAEGPVPEIVLYRLLRVAGEAIQVELDRVAPGEKLTGLRLGYYALPVDRPELGKRYTVEWGDLPWKPEELDNMEELAEGQPLDPAENPVASEFLNTLTERLLEAMIEQTPPAVLEDLKLRILIHGVTSPSLLYLGIDNCCGNNKKRSLVKFQGFVVPSCSEWNCW